MFKLGAKELREKEPTEKELMRIKRFPIFFVLDNILDTFNTGSIFRLADAIAASKVYLCGKTATPSDPKVGHKIHKASVGTWRWVPWQYVLTAKEAVREIEKDKIPSQENQNIKISTSKKSHVSRLTSINVIALEQNPKSISYIKADYKLPLVLVVGHETYGVSKDVLKIADQIVEIPMFGVNKSLNVLVALSIAVYKAMEGIADI